MNDILQYIFNMLPMIDIISCNSVNKLFYNVSQNIFSQFKKSDNNLSPRVLHFYSQLNGCNYRDYTHIYNKYKHNYNYNMSIKLYYGKYSGELICTSITEYKFLLYNYNTKLWEKIEGVKNILNHFANNIYKLLDHLRNYCDIEFLRIKHFGTTEYLTHITELSETVNQQRNCIRNVYYTFDPTLPAIMKEIGELCYGLEFINNMKLSPTIKIREWVNSMCAG